jgi:hypothetical protein
MGQSIPRYRITWLTDPVAPVPLYNFDANADHYGTMGINNKGQVCYTYRPQPSDSLQSWVWLPSSEYGMSAGWNNIGTLTGLNLPNIARDINDSGTVVGQSAGVTLPYSASNTGIGTVTVWTLGSPVTFVASSDGVLGPSRGREWPPGGHAARCRVMPNRCQFHRLAAASTQSSRFPMPEGRSALDGTLPERL